MAPIWRIFFEVTLAKGSLATLSLGEGSDMQVFAPEAILTHQIPLTPYDAFALWMHINGSRLVAR